MITQVRFLLLSAFVASGGLGVLAACDSDVTARGSDPDAGDDAEADAVEGQADPDSSSPPDAGPPADRFVLVNGVSTLNYGMRVCILSSSSTDEPGLEDVLDGPALPDSHGGLEPGHYVSVVAPAGTLSGRSFRLAMFYTPALESFALSDKPCSEIVANVRKSAPGDDGGADDGLLVDGIDFELSTVSLPRDFFKEGGRYLVLATGCPRITPLDYAPGECVGGADQTYDGTVNYFRNIVYELDNTPAAAGKNRVQFLFASEATNRKIIDIDQIPPLVIPSVRYPDLEAGGSRSEHIVSLESDGGGQPFIEDSGALRPAPGTEVSDLKTMEGFEYNFYYEGSPTRFVAAETLESLSHDFKWAEVEPGKSYTFMMLGTPFMEPTLDDGGFNLASVHISVIPNY